MLDGSASLDQATMATGVTAFSAALNRSIIEHYQNIVAGKRKEVAESGQESRAELRALKRGHLGACSVRRNWYRPLPIPNDP